MRTIDDGPLPKNFPLSVANNGQFAKKFQGKRHQFGSVNLGWKAALERFNHDWAFICLGKVPPPMQIEGEPDPATLEYIATQFILREDTRRGRKQITDASFVQIRQAVEIFVTHVGKAKRVANMLPDDFADARDALAYQWVKVIEKWTKQEKTVSPATLCRRISHVRAMFNWAGPDGAKLLASSPNMGDGFKIVSESTIAKAKNQREREHGAKRWDVEDIERIWNKCDVQLKAMFLLSLNCAFTAADCGALPWKAIDLKAGFIDFARVKTGVDRMRLPMWPELIAALQAVKALGLSPAPGFADFVVHQDRGDNGEPIGAPIKLADCVFIMANGQPWLTRKVKLDESGLPKTESHRDNIYRAFAKLLDDLFIKRHGVGFSAGRHTFESHARRVADQGLVDAIMGHSTGKMAQRYDHALDADLWAMMNAVRDRLIMGTMRLADRQDGLKPAATAAPAMRYTG